MLNNNSEDENASSDADSSSRISEEIELKINLRNEEKFKNIKNVKCLAMDIGGSLVKLAFMSSYEKRTESFSDADDASDLLYSVSKCTEQVSSLNFIKFETKYIERAIDYIKTNLINHGLSEQKIKATGGGANKYRDLIKRKLGVELEKEDELTCLVNGCNFLLKNVPNEMFQFNIDSLNYEFKNMNAAEKTFPYLLVNIGSGVSIILVESESKFERVGGSTIGGSTLWGLGSLLTNAKCYDEILKLAQLGDNRTVDMLVKDIYGGNYEAFGLDGDLIASTLGKTTRSRLDLVNKENREEHLKHFKQEDLIRSILMMICYNISQLSTLYARLNNLNKVLFGGYFINNNEMIMKFLVYGISYWSSAKIECYFMRHEGYLGAVGAFIKMNEAANDHQNCTWYENFAHSSAYKTTQLLRPNSIQLGEEASSDLVDSQNDLDCFELNREEKKLVVFPFLCDKVNYIADLVDLTKDEEARLYWLECFEKTINTYERQCLKSYNCSNEFDEQKKIKRASEFKSSYLMKLHEIKLSPHAYGMLTVRSLLDLREHLMSEFKFVDVYLNEKREENKLGLDLLAVRLEELNKVLDPKEKWYHLLKGLLAGNVYDYGAQAFIEKQQAGALNHFSQALDSIDDNLKAHPDFIRLRDKLIMNSFNCVCIFADNSGFDIILGILPMVIELLKNKTTKVILCSNSKAAINDITHAELTLLIKKVCLIDQVLLESLNDKRLFLIDSGSASPCLDLSRVNADLARLSVDKRTDLIVLEGMGRAVHTNLNAKFKCDCLKAAVLKNKWLADRLSSICVESAAAQQTITNSNNGRFPIIFKYDQYELN